MSDVLNTSGISLVQSEWKLGEQPSALKFRLLFGSYTQTLTTICNLLGPLIGPISTAITPYSKDTVVSSSSYGTMSELERSNFYNDVARNILGTFNLARVIGPTGVLNPTYIPGSKHAKESQGLGYTLASGTKVQQLPFPPQREYTWTIADSDEFTWALVSSKEAVAVSADERVFYIDNSGTLYSSIPFPEGSTIKYDLEVPNTYSYLGAGYNCIPDLSILSLTLEERKIATGNVAPYDWGGVKISHDSTTSSNSVSRWKIELPKVISSRDQILSTADKTVSNGGFDPVGGYEDGSKYYYLNKDIYTPYLDVSIDDNLIVLYDSSRNAVYNLNLWEYSGLSEDVPRTYYATGPKSLEAELRNDAGALLSANPDTYNSKHFFIFVLGSSLSEQLAQTSLNFSRHKHDGYDSYRVHHKDLLGAEGELQGLGNQDGAGGGLDFKAYSRQLAYSNAKDNVHPQYLHRLGYAYGGTAGRHEAVGNVDKILDLNMVHGDLVLGPIEDDAATNTYSYKYASAGAASSAPEESINWTLTSSNVATSLEALDEKRSHSLVFGIPSTALPGIFYQAWYSGSTRLYFEPHVFDTDTKYDKQAQIYKLSRHGFIPGEVTNRKYFSKNNHIKGLNITYGNLFFGYREDLFGGLLTTEGLEETESSAYFRAAEFNIVTTANSKSGQNTNSKIKQGYNYRDGFAVRALKGSNIWLSTGAESADPADITTGKNNLGIPGTIALEASYPASQTLVYGGETGLYSLLTNNTADPRGDGIGSGSGVFLAPGPKVDIENSRYVTPWAASLTDGEQTFATLWDGNSLGTIVSSGISDGTATDPGPGSLLDLFAIAPDRQKNLLLSKGNIPIGRDSNIKGWIFGRPFIRGTYGINFCVNGDFEDIDPEFKTGYHKRISSPSTWGPNSPVLQTGSKEYIHREIRFWGKNDSYSNPSAGSRSLSNTQGSNINLLYNFGRNYSRWGLSMPWSSALSLSGQQTGNKAPWSNSRRVSLGSSEPSDYGSSIRQASFVEAFAGFRSDPLQPYTASYTIPFRVKYQITGSPLEVNAPSGASPGGVLGEVIGQSTFVLTNDDFVDSSLFTERRSNKSRYIWATPNGPSHSNGKLQIPKNIFVDQIIRGSEDMLIERSGPRINNSIYKIFPASLIGFDVKLEYFIGQRIDYAGFHAGNIGAGSPHFRIIGGTDPSPGGAKVDADFQQIRDRNAWMIPAYQSKMTTSDAYSISNRMNEYAANVLPVLMRGSGYAPEYQYYTGNSYNDLSFFNSIIGYDCAIGIAPSTRSISSTYDARFPNFHNIYEDQIGNKMFSLLINMQKNMDGLSNCPTPYRVYLGDANGLETPYRRFSFEKLQGAEGSSGDNAAMTITIPTNTSGGNYNLDMITFTPGTGNDFENLEAIVINGEDLGGITGTHDLTITIGTTNETGGILTLSSVSNTPYAPSPVSNIDTILWLEIRGRVMLNTMTALDTEYTEFIEE